MNIPSLSYFQYCWSFTPGSPRDLFNLCSLQNISTTWEQTPKYSEKKWFLSLPIITNLFILVIFFVLSDCNITHEGHLHSQHIFFFFQERIDFIVYMLFCPQGVLGRPGVSLEPADMVRSLHQCRCRCYNKESTGNGSIWDCHTFSNWLFFPRLCLGMHTHLIWAVAQCLSPRIVSVFLYEFTAGCSDCLCGIYNCRKLVVNL